MKILITGADGQLGSEIVWTIKNKNALGELPSEVVNAEIICVDVNDLDITNFESVQAFFVKNKPDVVINCAAITNVDGCENDLETSFKVNSLGPKNLAICAEQVGAKLLHISTDYVFSGTGTVPYSEWEMCNPQSIYGKSKYMGEYYIQQFCKKYFIVRTAWLYGKFGNNFVKTIIKAAKEKGQLKVVSDQIGNPTNCEDLAFHILKIITTQNYGIYHCTNEGECSWYDFASEIVKLANIECVVSPCSTDEYPRPAKRPAFSSLNNLMLKCTIGNEMRIWQDALKSFMKGFDL